MRCSQISLFFSNRQNACVCLLGGPRIRRGVKVCMLAMLFMLVFRASCASEFRGVRFLSCIAFWACWVHPAPIISLGVCCLGLVVFALLCFSHLFVGRWWMWVPMHTSVTLTRLLLFIYVSCDVGWLSISCVHVLVLKWLCACIPYCFMSFTARGKWCFPDSQEVQQQLFLSTARRW